MHLVKITETQIGAIAESLVAAKLIHASEGRLSPFKPIADDGGIDLLIYDKPTGRAIPIQVKSRTKTLNRHPNIVHFEVRLATFNKNQYAFFLCVLFEMETMNVKRAWLIPMSEFLHVSSTRKEKLVIRPSIKMDSKDRYSSYRCKDMTEVALRITNEFDKT